MKNSIKLFIILSIIATTQITKAQQIEVTRDVGTWLSAGVEHKVFNDVKLEFNQQIRLYHNFTRLDDYIGDLGIRYKINRNFSIGGGARYTYNLHRDGSYGHDIRYQFDFGYRCRLSQKFRLSYRLRYQKEYANLFDEPIGNNYHISDFRHRIKFEYLHSQVHTFYLSGEAYRTLKQFRNPYFSKMRFFAGDEINMGSDKIDLAIGVEQELNKTRPATFAFVSVSYCFLWK